MDTISGGKSVAHVAAGVDDATLKRLRWGNLGLTVLHLVQAVVVVLLASDFSIAVTETFPQGPPGSDQPAPEPLFEVTIGWAVAVFLALAALDHLATATVGRGAYERDLRRGVNRFRWVEYSFSATLMILLIASYAGITGVAALIGIAGANVAMILFGWRQELANPPGRNTTTMQPFWFGSVAGIFPWIAIAVSIIGAATTGEGVPGFVYGIFFAQFVFFFSFAVNQWLQYRGVGRWRSYAFGEGGYLVLSLGAKSVLAWQIFAGSLQGS
ncbi:MAG: heliorhodopsin HeR [Nitriliruptorales bacterium]|nr:heliorhodopsin HeR [Nitriliruptorales bacterium]